MKNEEKIFLFNTHKANQVQRCTEPWWLWVGGRWLKFKANPHSAFQARLGAGEGKESCLRKKKKRSGEIAQLGKKLPCKHVDLNLIPRSHHVRKPGAVACAHWPDPGLGNKVDGS